MAGTKRDAEAFAKRWAGRGDENQETQLYWIDLFQSVLGLEDALERLKFEEPVVTDSGSKHAGFIDVLIPSASALVEQKSLGVDLDKPEPRQGRMVTPAEQGRGYAVGLPLSRQPRYVITCNFSTIRVYDRNSDPLCTHDPQLEIELADLPKNIAALQFLKGAGEAPASVARAVSVEAGRIMGQIHNRIAPLYHDPDSEESHHALSVLCTRLMFLMFCEDAGLIEPGLFQRYVAASDAAHLRRALLDLFAWLDTDDEARTDEYPDELMARFPYIDGGLFREKIAIPQLDETVRTEILVSGCQEFDWSGVDPTVFGSIFEGALSHDARRAGGMHYTSPENIHRVIDPLFLDDLKAELDDILAKQNPSARTRALRAYHDKLGSLTFLDPACGSGNFLTETYVCLRRLENRVLMELQKDGQTSLAFEDVAESPVKVTLANFHGIEINDFACCVARTALWIAEKQADINTAKVVQRVYNELPLKEYDTVRKGNALRIDWNDVVPAEECDYIMGNPPFIGQYTKTAEQTEDVKLVWGMDYDGYLDYATCWYKKAAEFLIKPGASFAFVSTNSITQGQPVPALFKPLIRMGWFILFAHRTFVWDSQAEDEAHVHVVIVGLSRNSAKRTLFTHPKDAETVVEHPENINGYLIGAPDVFVEKRMRPLCRDLSPMMIGGKPADGGFFQIKTREELCPVLADPIAAKYVRRSLGAQELINGKERWCLWLKDAPAQDIASSPVLRERVEGVREFRLASRKAATRKMADTPWLYGEVREASGPFLCIPRHFSGGRKYFTAQRCEQGEIATDACFFADDPDGLLFAVISSLSFMAWQKAVGGELKSDCRFSNTIVWNNFPLPDLTDERRDAIIAAGSAVLEVRSNYKGASLAQLYKPGDEFLYGRLFSAHKLLDAAVEAAYGVDFSGDEEKIVAHLFKLYAERVGR
ncbi:DNA methyltransferase [Olsenella sp. An270]|uniref:DNA methyltransferase n=1 Tax=Olsenella sp. An270 TaxID=1965615 RepID=UPI000B369F8E|nr:DNA methyltransferase [Olsenella sp. An270]OUO60204.1 hypothetical protein B5F73_02560 [Olsenella sp. An270]